MNHDVIIFYIGNDVHAMLVEQEYMGKIVRVGAHLNMLSTASDAFANDSGMRQTFMVEPCAMQQLDRVASVRTVQCQATA